MNYTEITTCLRCQEPSKHGHYCRECRRELARLWDKYVSRTEDLR